MMKRIAALVLSLLIIFSFSACSSDFDAEEAVGRFDSFAEQLGGSQITSDEKLIGKRKYAGNDRYTGSYIAECDNADGRDVIFGGASVKERKIKLAVNSITASGSFKIRVRLGSETEEYTVEGTGGFVKELYFNGGGNYIMIDYESFNGKVELSAEYI